MLLGLPFQTAVKNAVVESGLEEIGRVYDEDDEIYLVGDVRLEVQAIQFIITPKWDFLRICGGYTSHQLAQQLNLSFGFEIHAWHVKEGEVRFFNMILP